jgi:type II secretory pathway component PulM
VLEKLSDQAEVSGNGLHVQIATIAFDVWIKWAESLQANQGIRVVSCQISPNIKAGEVRVDAVLGAQN